MEDRFGHGECQSMQTRREMKVNCEHVHGWTIHSVMFSTFYFQKFPHSLIIAYIGLASIIILPLNMYSVCALPRLVHFLHSRALAKREI